MLAEPRQAAPLEGEKLTEQSLKAIIAAEMDNALGVDGGKLSISRRDALKQYLGEPYGNELDGRSQVVDRTILETVEWVLPALIRIFMASEKTVEFEPGRPGEEAVAKQATDYCNYIFNRDNEGFLNTHSWFKDALLQKLGFLKCYWDTERTIETEKYSGLSEDEYQAIIADPDVEVVEQRSYPGDLPDIGLVHQQETREGEQPLNPGQPLSPLSPSPAEAPQVQAPTLYDCTLRRTRNEGRVRIVPVPPEEILVSRRATSIQSSPFVCHRVKKTHTELLEAGYDQETVSQLTPFDEQEYNTERVQRYQKEDEWPYRSTRTDPPMVEVWVNECYIRVDWDGDGLAELRKITVAGDKNYVILDNEEVDEIPIIGITPIPMPHILFGLSLADLVSDLQLIKTVLVRQILDNVYLANNPRTYVNEDSVTENTYDDLLTSRPGGIVRGRGPMGNVVAPFETPFIAQQAFPLVEYMDQRGEQRTGVARMNQGLAPDDLNKNAAIGSMGMMSLQEAAAQRVELIARIFAETGFKPLFKMLLGLVIRNQDAPREIRLTGDWIKIDPSTWRRNMDVTVAVGLGTGNRDKMKMDLMSMLQWQVQAIQMQGGPHGPLVTMDNVYNAGAELVKTLGFKNTDRFITNPKNVPPQPPQPNPEVQKAQMQAQTDLQKEAMRGAVQKQIAEMKTASEAQLKQLQFMMEAQVKAFEAKLDAQVGMHANLTRPQPQVRFGGNQI